ncbi:hypothetical protein J2O02_18310 (plasmid) [Elizabethkingia anophelis]|uniref:hypothetical protein n=1 Tax=Elizabethkingia anophelis TaxID=1117645 RepID=UPI0020B69F7C|nr:hypothetical protein [Elizabethkingia anophelis]UTG66820.1 hypothetical protein J2O02_18310 [Elizabethkingia anophelis]
MKKFRFLLVMILLSSLYNAQFGVPTTVYDPTASVNMGKQIAASTEQLTQLQKSVEYLKKAEEKVNQVNSYVRSMDELKNVIELQRKSLINATKVKEKVARIKNPMMRKMMITNTSNALTEISSSIVMINKILSSGFFQMTDTERMEWIRKQRDRVFSNYQKIKRYSL